MPCCRRVFNPMLYLTINSGKVDIKIHSPSIFYTRLPYQMIMKAYVLNYKIKKKRAARCNYQQCGILTSVVLDEPLQPPVKLRNSK